MKLIQPTDLYFGRKGFLAKMQSVLIMRLAGLKKINQLYDKAYAYEGPFAEGALRDLQISYQTDPKETGNIPRQGAAIVIANHPTGALDGIILIDLLTRIRPDVKFMGNFLLERLEPLKQYFINVDPFDGNARSNVGGLRASLEHLRSGGLLVIFPAGEVATWQRGFSCIRDKQWAASAVRFIRKAEVPVVPVYIGARNSLLFHLAGKLHPMLRTALLPRELTNKKRKKVSLRIASPIPPRKTEELDQTKIYGDFLRANVEYLKPLPGRRRPKRAARRAAKRVADEVIGAVGPEILTAELDGIRAEHLLFNHGVYEVYLAPPELIPAMMTEIGRLREVTFREIGEGTKNGIDTDRFDAYYYQLFVWDREKSALVGAYRMGMGDQIMQRYGLKGFYTNTLFRMAPPMGSVMSKTIELGRSFIVKEYQRKPISLMLLWKGILHVLLKNGQYRYLLGPVTISGDFQNSSKLLIASHIRTFHRDVKNAPHVKPRTGIAVSGKIDESLTEGIPSLELINKLVCDIERNALSVPVLIRKYIQLNSCVLGFNTDHEFCDALDALMLLDLKKVPEEIIAMLSKELTDIDVIGRFRHIVD